MRAFIVAAIAALLIAAGAIASAAVSPFPTPRSCFPASRWNVTDKEYRPCVRIKRLYEDGSFKYAVSDANGTVRYSGGVGAADR